MSRSGMAAHVEDLHWGIRPGRIFRINDPALPAQLGEMGKLEAIEIEGRRGAGGFAPFEIRFPESDHIILAFDKPPNDPKQARLYNVLPQNIRAEMRRRFWDAAPDETALPLQVLAEQVGGRQAKRRYPPRVAAIPVKPIGVVGHVIYYAPKGDFEAWEDGREPEEEDGLSHYDHRLGEWGGPKPVLAVDPAGRLWWAGGGYWLERKGICN